MDNGNLSEEESDNIPVADRVKLPSHRGLPVVEVVVGELLLDESPRLKLVDAAHVHVLQESQAALPPILVHSRTMMVIDGIHRVRAAIAKGMKKIEARMFDGSMEEAYVLSVKLNIEHGLPLSLGERRSAALRIVNIYPEWSDGAVGGVTGLSPKTVAKLRRNNSLDILNPKRRVGRDGRVRPLACDDGRILASQVIADRPQASLREIARIAGVSPNTARDVRNRVRNGEGPVPAGRGVAAKPDECAGPRSTDHIASVARRRMLPGGDVSISWETLKRDPSLRSTEVGRFLLRSLSVQALDAGAWSRVVQAVPQHWAQGVADLSRQCAAAWLELAERLEGGRA